jgi:hypothetical protein
LEEGEARGGGRESIVVTALTETGRNWRREKQQMEVERVFVY